MAELNKLNQAADFFQRMHQANMKPNEKPAACEHCGAVSMPAGADMNSQPEAEKPLKK